MTPSPRGDGQAVQPLPPEAFKPQPHTEETIDHTNGQQNTGNHKTPDAPDKGGADKFGGTRSGAENVEHAPDAVSDQPSAGPVP